MTRLWIPAGMAALLLSVPALSAQQVREQRRQDAAPAQARQRELKRNNDAESVRKHRRGHVYLGVYTVPVEDLSNRSRKKMKLQSTEGVIVVEVMPDSPADEAGLRHGDVITHVNGKLVEDEEELRKDLNEQGTGKPVKLDVIRDGEKKEIKAELEEAPPGGLQPMFGPEEQIGGMMGLGHENAQRIERLERKIARLERRLADMEKSRSSGSKE